MRVLVIAEDLRVSGTSEGQVSRSFIYKLSMYPGISEIDLVYFKVNEDNHLLEKLPVKDKTIHQIPRLNYPFIKFFEKVSHKLLGRSLIDSIKIGWIKKRLKSIDLSKYDRIFVRSTGQSFLTVRSSSVFSGNEHKVVLYFHDPYPVYWDPGFHGNLTLISRNSFVEMKELVSRGFICSSPSQYLSRDLQFLYGSKNPFWTIPHQFSQEVFEMPIDAKLEQANGKITIMYHGALQLGRNIEPFLLAFKELSEENKAFRDQVVLVLRLKGKNVSELHDRFRNVGNINFLDLIPVANAFREIVEYSSINLVVEPSGVYSNILVGKAPLLASLKKPVFLLGPQDSELKKLIASDEYCANSEDKEEIKAKLLGLTHKIASSKEIKMEALEKYFSLESFFHSLDQVFAD